jgi:murein DD-endopeptidase MepM/ murein hydrolase activator NlpD
MFRPRELAEAGAGGPPGIGARPFSRQIVAAPPAIPRWSDRLAAIDWAPDLAERIGSARWFRGLATLLCLSALAIAFAPSLTRIEAPPSQRFTAAMGDEFRRNGVTPLAYGADSGRRTVPGSMVRAAAGTAPERAQISLTVVLGQGDTFTAMLMRAGTSAADAAQAVNLIGQAIPLARIVPGTQVDLTLGRRFIDGRPLEHMGFRAGFDLDLAVSRSGGGALALVRKPIAVDATPLRIRGTVGESLYRSARAAGAPMEAVAQYLQALDQHLALDTDISPADTFDIVVAFRRSAAGEIQVGDLLYAGLNRGNSPRAQLLRWGSDGQFFEASGMGAQRTGLLMPVVGHITSVFGMRRHPILGYSRLHAGIDFGAAWGSPIYAVGDATVIYAGWHGGHGNYVRLDHGGGFATGYGHMSRIAVGMGTRVRGGQVIGYVGSTGLSTGPHLHYELYKGGVPVDPLSVKFTVSNQVDAGELAAFKAKLAGFKAIVPGAALNPIGPRQGSSTLVPQREIARLGN